MKFLLPFISLYCLAGTTPGQAPIPLPVDKVTHHISYRALVPVAGASQADLLARARGWAQELPIVSSGKDKEVVLTTSGSQPFAYTFPPVEQKTKPYPQHTYQHILHYTVKLSLREGSYQYEVTDFVFEYPNARVRLLPAEAPLLEAIPLSEQGAIINNTMRTKFKQTATQLLTGLKGAMNKPN